MTCEYGWVISWSIGWSILGLNKVLSVDVLQETKFNLLYGDEKPLFGLYHKVHTMYLVRKKKVSLRVDVWQIYMPERCHKCTMDKICTNQFIVNWTFYMGIWWLARREWRSKCDLREKPMNDALHCMTEMWVLSSVCRIICTMWLL